MDTVRNADELQKSRESAAQTEHHCKCGCGQIGFVFIEETGQYLCRQAYEKYNKERLEFARRFMKKNRKG